MGFIIIYVTCPDRKTAVRISEYLLEKKIVACANMFPIKSMYWWKGKVNRENEIALVIKTSESKWKDVKSEVERMHPYDVPCITKINAEANEEYEKWIHDETQRI